MNRDLLTAGPTKFHAAGQDPKPGNRAIFFCVWLPHSVIMRRIYYLYPQRCDLSFTMGMPFGETLRYIADLNGAESTKTNGKELVRIKVKIEIPVNRAEFGDITANDLRPGAVTEEADLQVSVLALALRGGGKVPVANDIFYVRLVDQGDCTDISIVKGNQDEGLNAADIKNILLGKTA